MSKAHFGLVGLGVMGENLVLNAERNGFSSVVFNRTYSKTEEFLQGRGLGKNIEGAETLQEFVNKLERPRRILMMVKAGPATDAVIDNISGYLEEGDLLIDGGNSQFKDTERRVNTLESKSFGYIGMGVSGGAKGALEGPSMMPGGTKASYDAIESLLTKMAAKVEDGPCVAYVGPGGSGHFVKTVHNGIEYGIEQILAEAYDLMKRVKGMNGQQMSEVFGIWNNTDELASYLVEITEICLNTKDEITGDDVVEKILDKAKELEAKMKESQENIKKIRVEGISGANSVKVILDGEGVMQKIEISDETLKENKSVLEDLITAAHNNAKSKLREKTNEEISKTAGGFGIPGFKWPL